MDDSPSAYSRDGVRMMKRLSLWFALFSVFGLGISLPARSFDEKLSLSFNVTVIDATGRDAMPDQTVVITRGRISAMGKSGAVVLPDNAQMVDATGKFLIPGLWDMHIHTLQSGRPELFFPLLLASGVTGVRDPGSPFSELQDVRRLREQIENGELLGPRVVAAGPLVDGPNPVFPKLSIAVTNEIEAREVVSALKSGGADFIKIYQLLSRDAYFAIADEANRRNIPFAGHVPDSVSAAEASNAGQRSIEHLSGIRLACSTSEDELRKELIEARAKSDASLLYRALRRVYTKSLETYSEEKAEALFARFVANETWQVPTLEVARFVAQLNKSGAAAGATQGAIPALHSRKRLRELTADESESVSSNAQNAFTLVSAMRRAGVKFMAGTDAPNPFVVPGQSLHDELELLVQAGFTPMEALQSATRNPAQYLELLDTLGTVEQGKIADLVLLEGDPLEDINNTRKISAIILRGKLLAKPRLEKMSLKGAALIEALRTTGASTNMIGEAGDSFPAL